MSQRFVRSPPKPLADFIEPCLGKALAKQGFAASDIITAWRDIVGERLAAYSQPIRVDWPKRGATRGGDAHPDPATLVVRVEGAFALDLQHLAPVVIQRVNGFFGWACIGRLVLKQAPVRRKVPQRPQVRGLDPDEKARLDASLGGIEADGLQEALARLGSAVVGSGGHEPER
jgi:hypothetical protein